MVTKVRQLSLEQKGDARSSLLRLIAMRGRVTGRGKPHSPLKFYFKTHDEYKLNKKKKIKG